MPVQSTTSSYQFSVGLESVSSRDLHPETFIPDSGNLLRQESKVEDHLSDMFKGFELDSYLFDSIKPAARQTTRAGILPISSRLSKILDGLPELASSSGIPEHALEKFTNTLREEIGNLELLAACRRALISG